MMQGLSARRGAVAVLERVLADGAVLSAVVDDPAGPLAPLAPEERARALRLALTVLRRTEPVDRALAPHLRKAPPLRVRMILRLAVCELVERPQDAHGIVNAAVTLVSDDRRMASLAGLVNAVLRRVASQTDPLAGMPPQRLPQWLRQPLVRAWGRPAVTGMETVQAVAPPLDLTPRDPAGAGALAARLAEAGHLAEVLPTGSLRLAAGAQVSALPGYAEGEWWVQDAAAAVGARMLGPVTGLRVLDLCAAPGGKTLQLAAAGADVTALDISGPRMARAEANLARCGLVARCVVADALHWVPEDGAFDAVLLDAPCSATGTIRRHPDLPFVKDCSDLPVLVALQASLIDRAVALLRPGGRLVFCTCSLLPEEGEAQLSAALARHPGLRIEAPVLPGLPADWSAPEGGLRLRPDHWAERGGIDGFFIAALRCG